MNKKFLLLTVLSALFTLPAFSRSGFEAGIGSGYIFYGDKEVKERNKLLGDTNQSVLYLDAHALFPLDDSLFITLGTDSVFDFRWKDGNHVYLIDQAFLLGLRVYPNLAGFFVSMDYSVGKRTDFVELDDYDDTVSSKWGNGFKFAVGYDFSYHLKSYAPVLYASLKSMPRGGSRDNILCVALKLTRHK